MAGGLLTAPAEEPQALKPLYVTGRSLTEPWSMSETIVGSQAPVATDAAGLLRGIPGAAAVRNGPQTGIVQLRGLSGDRVGVRVNGMAITPACPNHMDPPLHYASPAQDDRITTYAGIAPVSAGGDRIGGVLEVAALPPEFAADGGWRTGGRLGTSFLGSQDTWSGAADLAIANRDLAFEYHGAGATADDLRFAGGRVADTGYEVTSHDLIAAWRTGAGFVAVDAGFSFTRDAGTPALPMDMVKADAWHLGLRQQEELGWGTVENRLYVHDIDHVMDNFSLRQAPVPPMGMPMEAPSTSRDFGWTGGVILPRGDDTFRIGVDLHRNEFEAEQVAVMTGMRRDTFHDNERDRAGLYVDWERGWSPRWITRAGLRCDWVSTDAGQVSNAILPPPGPMRDMLVMDQARFNAADRSFTDALPSATAAVRFLPDDTTAIDLGVGLTSRAPSLVERYLWTPLNASAGLADGRTYLGNLGLDPELGLEIALGVSKRGERWRASVTPFYQNVYDYIQGMPIARTDMNGLPVLQYRNIDRAELYGAELSGGYEFTEEWSVSALASYVRGENADTGDALYRIAPLHGIIDLSWRRDSWESHLEFVWAAEQDRVSGVQGEPTSPGFGLLNLRVAKTIAEALRVEVGVENLFDKNYAEHLSGVNRVAAGDVAVGDRIPGAGRFAYASLGWEF